MSKALRKMQAAFGGSSGLASSRSPSRLADPFAEVLGPSLAAAEIPVRKLSDALSEAEMRDPNLVLLVEDLTDRNQVEELVKRAGSIQAARRTAKGARDGFVPSLVVVGGGADYSERFPYRSPEVQEARERLLREGVLFYELPGGAKTPAEIRRRFKGLFRTSRKED